jgi:hypothetical protein
MAPISLSDQQLDAVYAACRPLLQADRDRFLRALANVHADGPQPPGDGALWRAIKDLQREYFRPPAVAANREAVHRPVRGEPIA